MTMDISYAGEILNDLDRQDRYMELARVLRDHKCEVTFTKVDGSVRTMPCTLMVSELPAREESKVVESREPNYNTISVWCLDKKEWRSFRVANVKNIKVIDA